MNTYYIAGYPISDELYHHGILGQKWGIRRYQNPDGTLTAAGKKRYGKLVAQNMLLSPVGGYAYREFRSQDNSRGKALAKTIGSMIVPYGVVWAPMVGQKHKFG